VARCGELLTYPISVAIASVENLENLCFHTVSIQVVDGFLRGIQGAAVSMRVMVIPEELQHRLPVPRHRDSASLQQFDVNCA
jgi:hypothetical protein